MKRRIVIDTNLWIRALLGGPATLPLLDAWEASKFVVVISQPLLDERRQGKRSKRPASLAKALAKYHRELLSRMTNQAELYWNLPICATSSCTGRPQ